MAKPSRYLTTRWIEQQRPELERHCSTVLGSRARLGESLGSGYWGRAFALDRRWALKLTLDPTEGPIWFSIMSNRSLAQMLGIVEIKHVAFVSPRSGIRIPDKATDEPGGNYTVYAIVREQVVSVFSSTGRKQQIGLLNLAYEAAGEYEATALESHRDVWYNALLELQEDPELVHVAQFLFQAELQGLLIADAHAGNVGTGRDGVVKVFDPGHSILPAKVRKELERLIPSNPGIPPLLGSRHGLRRR